MRNLKRALSLVMAMALIVGMMMVSASAASTDFTDADEIDHKEAVDVLVTLNVISGKEDGSYYDPDGTLTRAEMAKIVAYVMNGGTEPNIGTKLVPTYSDIDNHWAEAYIEYCTSMGIIAGDGAGKFNPNGTLTATQTAKMFLTAMGYNAEVFGLLGTDWETNTNRYANEAGLYENLADVGVSDPISRDDAAQMAYNAIQAVIVERTWSQNQTTGQITEGYELSRDKDTLLSTRFGVIKVEGVVTENEFTEGSGKAGKTSITVTNYAPDGSEEQDVFSSGNYNVTTGPDEIGKNVTLYVKPYSSNSSSISRATVLGGAIINDNNTVYTTSDELVTTTTKSNYIVDVLKDEGLKFDASSTATVTVYTNYADSTVTNPTGSLSSLVNTSGVEAQYIDNDADGVIDVVTFVQRGFGKVLVISDVDDGTLTVSNLGIYASDYPSTQEARDDIYDFDNLDIAKDDYVFFYRVNTTGLYYIEKAESVTVDITSTQGDKVTGSGTAYEKSGLANYLNSNNETVLANAVTIGESAVLYLDGNGDVVYVTDVTSESHYLVVLESNDSDTINTFTPLQAKMLLEDGTIVTAQISSIGGTSVSNTNKTLNEIGAASAKIYSYTVNSDGRYALTDADDASNSVSTLTAVKKNNPDLGSGVVANNNTIFVLGNADKDSFSVYTGIGSVVTTESLTAANTAVLYSDSNSVAKIVFAYGGAGAANTGKNIYVLDKTPIVTKDDDDNNVYTYKVLVDGVETDLVATDAAATNAFASVGLYVNQTISADNKITVASQLTSGVAATDVTSCGNGVIKAVTGNEGVQTLAYNDNTKVLVIDAETGEVSEGSIEMITVVTGNTAATSDVVMTRASNTSTDADYSVAGIVYIVK